jgi:hypothetical protein
MVQGRIVRERDKSRVRKVALDDNGKPAISMKELKVCLIHLGF